MNLFNHIKLYVLLIKLCLISLINKKKFFFKFLYSYLYLIINIPILIWSTINLVFRLRFKSLKVS